MATATMGAVIVNATTPTTTSTTRFATSRSPAPDGLDVEQRLVRERQRAEASPVDPLETHRHLHVDPGVEEGAEEPVALLAAHGAHDDDGAADARPLQGREGFRG